MTGAASGVRIGVEACQGRSNPLPEHLGGRSPRRRVGQCADAESRGRHGRIQQHRAARPGGLIQSGSAVNSVSPGSAVQEANVGNDGGGGFIPEGNAGVNGGSENPGALHPTKQGRLALWIRKSALRVPAVQDSATVWGLRAETGSGRFRFVHHLGFSGCLEEHPNSLNSRTSTMRAHGSAELRARSGRPARAKMLTAALWWAWAWHPAGSAREHRLRRPVSLVGVPADAAGLQCSRGRQFGTPVLQRHRCPAWSR